MVATQICQVPLGCGQHTLSWGRSGAAGGNAGLGQPCDGLCVRVLRRYYNMPSSDYYQVANKLQAFVDQYLANTVVAAPAAGAGAGAGAGTGGVAAAAAAAAAAVV